MERELITTKETMKQWEISKKELVGRMRNELDTVEARWLKVINENTMVAEDFRTRAVSNWLKLVYERTRLARSQRALHKVEAELAETQRQMQ